MGGGAAPHGRPQVAREDRVGKLENAGQRGLGRKEKQCTDCVAEDRRVFGITGDWSGIAQDPREKTARERCCRFMAAWENERRRRDGKGEGCTWS